MDDQKKRPTRREILVAGAGLAGIGSVASLALANGALPALARQTGASASQATSSNLPIKAIEAVFGVKGTMQPGGVLLIDLPRQDLHPVLFGVPVRADFGFDTEIAFQPTSSGAIVKYEFVLLDSEVNAVVNSLFNQHLTPATTVVNALHNHYLELSPSIKYLHGTSIGDPVEIAKELRHALEHSHQPFVSSAPGHSGLPNQEITEIIGGTSMVSEGVLSVSVEHKGTFRELGITLQPAMQLESMFNFQSIGGGKAAESFEIVVLAEEADAVIRSMREHSIFFTALHNHELLIEPHLYYIHGFATGDPLALAHATRDALNHTNSK